MTETQITPRQTQTEDGWTPAKETWTYASANTITVPSGAASRYQKGDRIKWTQTSVKYGVIISVSDTVLTIAVNDDYTVANAAITDNYFSHQTNPIGYPQWFNYTPTITGYSSNPIGTYKFSVEGNICFLNYRESVNGTSNSTSTTYTPPIPHGSSGDNIKTTGIFQFINNGTVSSTFGYIDFPSNSSAINFFTNCNNGTWTASGGKRVPTLNMFYEI